ncbi:MAG: serine hydrolase domain-containing protein [Pseudomonadales bacterium]
MKRQFALLLLLSMQLPMTAMASDIKNATAMQGVPPTEQSQVTFANYRDQPFSRWAFRNTGAFFNTLNIARSGPIDQFKLRPDKKIERIAWQKPPGEHKTLSDLFAANDADAVVILRNKKLVFEQYFNGMQASDRHIWFSMTKSLVSTAAGLLVASGKLDVNASPADYIPELKGSGFVRVSIQNVLDHDTALAFKENYSDYSSEFFRFYAPALKMAYLPGAADVQPGSGVIYGVHNFVTDFVKPDTTLQPGAQFDYNSANADVLGWLVARVSGMPLHRFVQQNIWSKLRTEHDASIAADRALMAVATGGMNTTVRDAARFGQLLLQNGKYKGEQIVPRAWVDAIVNVDDRLTTNMKHNSKYQNADWQAYHNMWWVLDAEKEEFCAVGIHGQVIYINRSANMVAAWFSSQQIASSVNSEKFGKKLAAIREIANHY